MQDNYSDFLKNQRSIGMAYAFLILFGIFGIHRLYIDATNDSGWVVLGMSAIGIGAIFTNSILAPFGYLAVVISCCVTFLDIFRIPKMVKDKNYLTMKQRGIDNYNFSLLK